MVVNDDRKILLIRDRNGKWVFPKGHVDPGETSLEAALREVSEEAGVDCECSDPDTIFTTEYVNARGESRLITWFLLETPAKRPVMREPLFPEGEFLAPAAALQRLSFEEDRELLRRILEWGI